MHTRQADHPDQRQSYLLRIWRASDQGALRATLIDVAAPHACRHFVSLDDLQNFLIGQSSPVGGSEATGEPTGSATIVHQTAGEGNYAGRNELKGMST